MMNGWTQNPIVAFADINPATFEPIGLFLKASIESIKIAVDCAENAFDS